MSKLKYRLIYAVGWLLGNILGTIEGLRDLAVVRIYRAMSWQDWKVLGYIVSGNGGKAGGNYTLRRMTRQQAERYVAKHFGTVVFVQERESIIFYRSQE